MGIWEGALRGGVEGLKGGVVRMWCWEGGELGGEVGGCMRCMT